MAGENEFGEYKRLFLSEFQDIKGDIRELQKSVNRIEQDIIALKIKSGLWGFFAGSIPGLAALLLKLLGVV